MMNNISVQLCYAIQGKKPVLVNLEVAHASTIGELLSRLNSMLTPASYSELHELLEQHAVIAIFGKKKPSDFVLSANDRIEICRPLIAGPMDARRHRAKREHKSGKM